MLSDRESAELAWAMFQRRIAEIERRLERIHATHSVRSEVAVEPEEEPEFQWSWGKAAGCATLGWVAGMAIAAAVISPIPLEAAIAAVLWSAIGAAGAATGVCLYADEAGRSP